MKSTFDASRFCISHLCENVSIITDMKKPDIFDRIMDLGIMKPFKPFYIKYKMPLLYLFFGGLTTVLSIFLFWFFSLKMSPLIANIISWIVCVIFAYCCDK